ncbi:MAG: hypothetical protein IJJ86_05140 [Clostridia bacterium]|nr:hypothetical protein [Clostridia bacterium]
MEEKKKRTITKVEKKVSEDATEVKAAAKKVEGLTKAEEKSKATTLRIVAAILWVLAIGCELLAILCLLKALRLPGLSRMWWMIIFIVIDLILCVIAGFLWKKAAHLAPFKKNNNKVLFYLLSQFAVIMAAVCFLPLIILVLASKEDKLDKKSKIVVTIVAVVAFVIAGLLGFDFNPIDDKAKAAASEQLGNFEKVYWTRYGHKYHLYENCQAIVNSTDVSYSEGETIDGEYVPAVRVAMDNGCTGLCAFCAREAEKEGVDLTGIIREDGTRIGNDELPADNQDLTVAPDGE